MLLMLLLACTNTAPSDTGEADTQEEPATGDPCEELEVRVTGDDPPQVGDEWTVWLWCDDALMLGATRLFFDPNDIATVSENRAAFLYEGTASMTIQVGSRRMSRDVTITAE